MYFCTHFLQNTCMWSGRFQERVNYPASYSRHFCRHTDIGSQWFSHFDGLFPHMVLKCVQVLYPTFGWLHRSSKPPSSITSWDIAPRSSLTSTVDSWHLPLRAPVLWPVLGLPCHRSAGSWHPPTKPYAGEPWEPPGEGLEVAMNQWIEAKIYRETMDVPNNVEDSCTMFPSTNSGHENSAFFTWEWLGIGGIQKIKHLRSFTMFVA